MCSRCWRMYYYPFGLTMAGSSDRALAFGTGNHYKYNKGSEHEEKNFSDGGGLESYDTHLRELDPQLGRWFQIDSKPVYDQSVYCSMGNNPISHNDPLGDTLIDSKGNRISYTVDNKENITWGKNATADVKRLGYLMSKTKIGKEIFSKMVGAESGRINAILDDKTLMEV